MIFKKTMINLAMIETVLFMSSVNVGLSIPADNSLRACAFVFVVVACVSLIPAIGVSFLFAYAESR